MYYLSAEQEPSTSKLAAFFEKSKKMVHALRANESKVTLTNIFIDKVFALKKKKPSQNDKATSFRD